MRDGQVESTAIRAIPLDVLAQQIVANGRDGRLVRGRSLRRPSGAPPPFATFSVARFDGLLDMLSGRYPSD
jgi:ATP-dependent Lhr-like helicase